MKLLVNADDFGLTKCVTDGIIEAHKRGIVTSTSIIAGGTAFSYALQQALRNQDLGIGVHLTLVEEQPVSDPKQIPSLIDSNGKLPASYPALLSGLLLGRIQYQHVERELRAQVVKCLSSGLTPTHLDSHQHVHALPSILRVVIRIAEEFNIRCIRLPRDSPTRRAMLSNGFLQKTVLCAVSRWDAHSLPAQRFHRCDRMAGLFDSGSLREDRLLAIVAKLSHGTTELVCHPGREDRELYAAYAHWHYNWQAELDALTSETVRRALLARNIELINYKDLEQSAMSSVE